MNKDLCFLLLKELREGYKRKKFSPSEVISSHIQRIKDTEGKLDAFLDVYAEKAVSEARKIEADTNWAPEDMPLWGVPVAIKDNICLKGEVTRCASKVLEGFRPPYDATVVKCLKAAGAIIVGKANMDEFAFGSSTENSAYKVTHNPWDIERVPGGSSGGSCVAVAARQVPISLGSDTGGSVRQPASFCGVVGLKPTYDRVSRYGLIAFGSSLDQIGPISVDVYGAATFLNVIGGADSMDSTCVRSNPVNIEEIEQVKSPISRIGVLNLDRWAQNLQKEVLEAVNNTKEVLSNAGMSCSIAGFMDPKYALSVYYIVAPSEASSNLARYDGMHYGYKTNKPGDLIKTYENTRSEGFGKEAKRRVLLGTFALSSGYYEAYYLKAERVRTLIREDFKSAFEKFDVLLWPTSPTTAFKIGEKTQDPLSMYLSDLFTIPASLAGLPALNVPVGFDEKGLPLGVQLIGRPQEEERLFKVARILEKELKIYERSPEV